jgi:hypothetical protein
MGACATLLMLNELLYLLSVSRCVFCLAALLTLCHEVDVVQERSVHALRPESHRDLLLKALLCLLSVPVVYSACVLGNRSSSGFKHNKCFILVGSLLSLAPLLIFITGVRYLYYAAI